MKDSRPLLEGESRCELINWKPFDQFHHDRGRLVIVQHRMHGHDRRIAQSGDFPCLLQNALAGIGIRRSVKRFQGDLAVQLFVPCLVHDADASPPNPALDAESGNPRRRRVPFPVARQRVGQTHGCSRLRDGLPSALLEKITRLVVRTQQGLNLAPNGRVAGTGLLKKLLPLGRRTQLERAGKNIFGGTDVSHGRRSAKTF